MTRPTLLDLFLRFALLSLLAVGGASATLPEIHRQVVTLHGWMTSEEFASLFALAQAAPGPNVLIVSLVGWKVAGIPGALAATFGMCLPPALLAHAVGRAWGRHRDAPWRRAVAQGLAPLTLGLILGSGWLMVRAAGHPARAGLVAAAVAVLAYRSRRNPLVWLAGAALVGLAGGVG